MMHLLWRSFLRFAFHLFYNSFAFTYDFVSALVSRGRWRAWTRAAIPFIVGKRVFEIPCGTGNLLLDLSATGYAPIGADLSGSMLTITRGKLRESNRHVPLVRARAQMLPFCSNAFDSIVMTFPPGFVHDPHAFAELRRVLDDEGRLIWVDAARLLPHDVVSRLLNRALDVVDGSTAPFTTMARELLARAGFEAHIELVQDDASLVSVVTATPEPSN